MAQRSSQSGGKRREEVFNTHLAIFLRGENLDAAEESRTLRGIPDVVVDLDGARVLIEAKYDAPSAERGLQEQVRERLQKDPNTAAVVEVLYPDSLRTAEGAPEDNLRQSRLRWRIWRRGALPDKWENGAPGALADALYRLRSNLDTPKRLQEAVATMTHAVERAAADLGRHKSQGPRLAAVVKVSDPGSGLKIAALMVLNALVFQSRLASHDKRVKNLGAKRAERRAVAEHWRFICEKIGYVPIFRVAAEVLDAFPDGDLGRDVLNELIGAAEQIRDIRGHDLAGRVFHKLVDFAKPRAAYYTSLPAAALLASLAFDKRLGGTLAQTDWTDLESIRKLRVADLACGTGTLLLAAAREMERLHRNACGYTPGKSGTIEKPKPEALHKILIENVLHGYDVELTAVHLAAAHLGLLAPDAGFDNMNLFVLPCEVNESGIQFGSADFLFGSEVKVQFDLLAEVSATRRVEDSRSGAGVVTAQLPKLDLAILNPPFSRSMVSNKMFGDIPTEQRREMQKGLNKLLKAHESEIASKGLAHFSASTSAGLGAVILAAAARNLKPGGRLAAVLPAALCTGDAWAKSREVLAETLRLDAVVLSHDPERTNFSESTSLSECLVVATRRDYAEEAKRTAPRRAGKAGKMQRGSAEHPAAFLHLLHNPVGELDAAAAVRTVKPLLAEKRSARLDSEADLYWESANSAPWQRTRFASPRLADDAEHIAANPNLHPLSEFAGVGPDPRTVYDGFEDVERRTEYPAFWGHKTEERCSLTAAPNIFLSPIYEPRSRPGTARKRGLHKDYPDHLWGWGSGRVCLAWRVSLNYVRVLAVLVDQPVLANVWFPLRLKDENETALQALTAWLNSSYAFAAFLLLQTPTNGAWTQIKSRPTQSFPIPNLADPATITPLAQAFQSQKTATFAPLPQITTDPARHALDEACARTIPNLPTPDPLRRRIAAEPFVAGPTPRPQSTIWGHSPPQRDLL
ncbi:MAG: hypothetical protein OXU78_00005 [Deltaproteobacteria bacterium]|nr:hypothetical protein [Deltaproteobacteria bacterium]